MHHFLTKFLLLLCAALSLHSALALPLSSALATSYHSATDGVVLPEELNANTTLNAFALKQNSQSRLLLSLQALQQKSHGDNIALTLFIATFNELEFDVSHCNIQKLAQQSYQEQRITHTHIQGRQNTLYAQSPSYQAQLQRQ